MTCVEDGTLKRGLDEGGERMKGRARKEVDEPPVRILQKGGVLRLGQRQVPATVHYKSRSSDVLGQSGVERAK
ncbi:hypothetical protein KC359_g1 [Hortaea werneckii]|nr:hypothetical protein KC359_g1 [Hortaea werneckii]KAI7514876.1 hypothetical protein KC347_g1 [Hortaea werneckii]